MKPEDSNVQISFFFSCENLSADFFFINQFPKIESDVDYF